MDFIEKLPGVGPIGIWGRSMGAATTLLYAHTDPRVKAICVDSPFEKFEKLAEELVIKQINLPKFLIAGALKIIKGTVKGKNGLDISKLNPIDKVEKTYQPAIFIHAINDELINVEHSINLCNKYGGPKSLKCCDKGGHNSRRPKIVIKEIGEFFKKYLCGKDAETEDQQTDKLIKNFIKNNENNIMNEKHNYDNNIDDNEENEEEEDYENMEINDDMYEEDYIMNQIINEQNKENKDKVNKKEKNEKYNIEEKRIEKIMKEEKNQIEDVKKALLHLSLNSKEQKDVNDINNNNEINGDENNINNNLNNIENMDSDNEEEYKNNSSNDIENGGNF